MNSKAAIETLMSQAASYIDNVGGGLPHGNEVEASTTDDQLRAWAGNDAFEFARYREIRDYERASDVAQTILNQRGCELFGLFGDGSLTSLVDMMVFG
jgi:hypothetical protein